MRIRNMAWLVATAGLVVACSSSGGGSTGGGGSGTTGTGGSSSTTAGSGGGATTSTGGGEGGAGALCTNPPANTAPQISDQYSAAAMPAMGTATGGTLESGTYYMTAITDYESSDSGGTHKDTMVLDTASSTMAVAEVNGGKAKPPIAGAISTSGSKLTLTLVCPGAGSAPYEYTYAAGTFTIYDYNSKSVSVWTKQ